MWRRRLCFLLDLFVLGCVGPARPLTAAKIAGCYTFERRDSVAEPLGFELPDTVRLDSLPNRTPDGRLNAIAPLRLELISRRPDEGRDTLRLDARHVVPWPPAWQRYYTLLGWRFTAPDSVTVVYHANMSDSWRLGLRARADSLIGVAVMYSDVVTATPKQIALAGRRIACGAGAT